MSVKTKTTAVCDIPGLCEPAEDHGDARTISFGLDGEQWEAEFCAGHETAIATGLEPFIAAARPARDGARPRLRSRSARSRSAAIRAWALHRGMSISERGRLPASVVAKYDAEHGGRCA